MSSWIKNYRPFFKHMTMWFGMVVLLPLLVIMVAAEDCYGYDDVGVTEAIERKQGVALNLAWLPLWSIELEDGRDNGNELWLGGYWISTSSGHDFWLFEQGSLDWERQEELSVIFWGLGAGVFVPSSGGKRDIFLAASAGSRKGFISALRERVNPLAPEYITYSFSFVVLF